MPAQDHVVIGVHGLSRKPPQDQHAADWARAISEGLARNHSLDIPPDRLGFDLVYWADWLERAAYAPGEDTEPYIAAAGTGALASYQQRWFDDDIRDALDKVADPIDRVKSAPAADWIRAHSGLDEAGVRLIQKRLEDLGTYYRDAGKRALLRGRLADALVRHEGKRIMLVAHSMGSIVAYDVLRDLGRKRPAMVIDHLVTIGSPLGMPYVLNRMRQEDPVVCTPSVVRRWTNLADRRDPIAIDVHLRDEYDPNQTNVAVEDVLVLNTYRSPAGKRNHHKIYGYLRAPELSRLFREFM